MNLALRGDELVNASATIPVRRAALSRGVIFLVKSPPAPVAELLANLILLIA
jgi:hypothetical protein